MKLAQIGLAALTLFAASAHADDALKAAIAGPQRTEAYAARDTYRHPYETLSFFGIRPDMTVVELAPGGGWYTEILAPYLKDHGKLYAAHYPADSSSDYYRKSRASFEAKLKADPTHYGKVEITSFNPPDALNIAPAGSADLVVTFRNVHNWYMRGGGDAKLDAAFGAVYTALKPGGVFGVVDHRLPATRPAADQEDSGYMLESVIIAAAERAGLKLVEKSEINANPKDTADHPKGVWTLPPSLRGDEADQAKYKAIGESDRMTLKFVKPAKS